MSENTQELKRVLKFWDLMASAVGQIIGAGIMSLTGAAIALTGKSTPIAFILSTVFVVCSALPYIFINSTIRTNGGMYTIVSLLVSKKLGGYFTIISVLGNLSLAMYALSASDYLMGLIGFGQRQIIATIILTAFMILNVVGIDAFAKVQNFMVILLVVSLFIFTVAGLPKVQWSTLTAPETWMTGGVSGLLRATTLLTFATGGGTTVVNLAAEAVNPTRDIPRVIVISTLGVAVLYAFMSIVAVGVLPIEQTAGQSLVNTARTVLPKPLFILFILGGAEMALASTLNNQLATATKPILQATWDGWFPASWGKLSKWKTPVFYLIVLYIIGMVTIWTGADIDAIGSLVLILGQFTAVFIAYSMTQLPKVIPDEWNESAFHVSNGTLMFCAILAFGTCILNFYLQCLGKPAWVVIGNVVMAVAALIYSFVRYNSGKVTQVVSYEKA